MYLLLTYHVKSGTPPHRSKMVQTFLEEKLKNRFVTASKWPPNCNLLDYLFLEKIKANVYYLRFFDRAVPE